MRGTGVVKKNSTGKGDRKYQIRKGLCMCVCACVCVCSVLREAFSKGGSFEQRSKRSKEGNQVTIWRKHIPGRGKSRCKSPEA